MIRCDNSQLTIEHKVNWQDLTHFLMIIIIITVIMTVVIRLMRKL